MISDDDLAEATIAAYEDDASVRGGNYVEEVVPLYSPDDFLSHF